MNYILGGGVSALVISELNNYSIISDVARIGGQAGSAFKLGPRILHDSETVARFLYRIGIEAKPREFKVKYFNRGKEIKKPTARQITGYFYKTRGNFAQTQSAMNGGKQSFMGYDWNDIMLLEVLLERNQDRIDRTIKKIDNIDVFNDIISLEKEDGSLERLPYENLISTLDLAEFSHLSGIGKPNVILESKRNVVFTRCRKMSSFSNLFDFGYADFIYYMDSKLMNRATRISSVELVIESNAIISPEKLNELGLVKLEQIVTNSQITKELKFDSICDVLMVGRYAQYDHSVKLDTIIERFMV